MPTFTKSLILTEVKYGLLIVRDFKTFFPKENENVIIIDEDGEKFHSHMHSAQPRIDGLTSLIKNKHKAKVGDKVTITVDIGKIGEAQIKFEEEHKIIIPPDSEPESKIQEVNTIENQDLLITPSLESMLEDFIVNNLSSLESNLKLFQDSDGIEGQQYDTEVGIIDLLCVDDSNNFVVIEIKKGRESDRVVGQISRYIGWVKKNLALNGERVRGIIIVHKPTSSYVKDEKLYYAVLSNPNIELRYYEIKLNFYQRGVEF